MLPWSFEIKCRLGYEISGPASFLFNVAVAQNSFQRINTEHLKVAGAESCQEMVIGGQRYHRVTAQRGPVELIYEAVVDATHELPGDPSRLQVPLFEQIPTEAMVSFTRAVFVSQIYSPGLRNASLTKTSLGSTELRGYVTGSSSASSICSG